MMTTTEKLLKGFTELCEELVSEAYVVTNGRAVMSTVLDHELAVHLCKLSNRKLGTNDWKVAKIQDALELAYRTGYIAAVEEHKNIDGEQDEKDSELRECSIQHEEESS